MKNYTFWPCLFAFLIFASNDFFTYQEKFLELDFQMKKPKSILDGIFIIPPSDSPPLNIPESNPDDAKKLDPKAGDSADNQDNQSSGVSTTTRQS